MTQCAVKRLHRVKGDSCTGPGHLTSSVEVEAFLFLLLLDSLVQESHCLVEVSLPEWTSTLATATAVLLLSHRKHSTAKSLYVSTSCLEALQ